MVDPLTREAIIEEACLLAATQPGGTLASMHAEDGTPYVTFVLFHLRPNGEVVFGSGQGPQHSRNMLATPEVSFLIDNREVIRSEWTGFNRVVIEGTAEVVEAGSADYATLLAELGAKNKMAAYFTEHGLLFRLRPRRLILMKGFEPTRHMVDFGG